MILVTGGTGLVGGNLMWYLLQDNERITAIHRQSSNLESLRTIFSFYTSTPDLFLNRIDWKIADMLDLESINQVMKGARIVYHCAAVVSLGNDVSELLETNVIGTRNIVRAALENNIQKLCFVSSIAACGKSDDSKMIDETGIWADSPNRSQYSRSKYYSEKEVWNGIYEGLNAVIVNPGIILGISGVDSGSSQLFFQVKKGLLFYTNGGSGYVDVQDVAKTMIRLVNSEISGGRFIVVAENCCNKDVLSWMADGFNKRRPFICVGKATLWLIGFIAEIFGKIFRFTPLIDRKTAISATHREFYSNQKILNRIEFKFNPIENCIKKICESMK